MNFPAFIIYTRDFDKNLLSVGSKINNPQKPIKYLKYLSQIIDRKQIAYAESEYAIRFHVTSPEDPDLEIRPKWPPGRLPEGSSISEPSGRTQNPTSPIDSLGRKTPYPIIKS